jgi:hypothetical protein
MRRFAAATGCRCVHGNDASRLRRVLEVRKDDIDDMALPFG